MVRPRCHAASRPGAIATPIVSRSRAWLDTARSAASAQLTSSLCAAFRAIRGERPGDVDQRPCLRRQDGEQLVPRRWRRRVGGERCGERRQCIGEVTARDVLAPSIVGDGRRRLACQRDRIVDAPQGGSHGERQVEHLAAGVGERDQVSAEVAAVDRRKVRRLERPEIPGVVPVVEVAVQALQAADRRQGRPEALAHLARADPAEVAGGDDREQVHADVGRGRPMRDDGRGVVLDVVRRQGVVQRSDEGLEEAPGATAVESQGLGVGIGELVGPSTRGASG